MESVEHSKKTLAALMIVIALMALAIIVSPGRMIDIATVPVGTGTGAMQIMGKAAHGTTRGATQGSLVIPGHGIDKGEVCRLPANRNMSVKAKLL